MKKTIALGFLTVVLLQGAAFGQAQSKKQQKCINALNKGMAKVATTQNKANAKCISNYAKGKNADAASCLGSAAKVDTAAAKTCTAETKKCVAPLPDFGYSSCGTVNGVSEYHATELASDIFGAGVNGGITLRSTDKPGFKCQGQVMKGVNKLYATHLKEFNKCKKNGLKNKTTPFIDVATLSNCVLSDPKMKIAKAQIKLSKGITKKCAAVASPFATGDCSGLNGSSLSSCLEKEVRCRVCLTLQQSDNLNTDCDDFDDDVSNNSCVDDF